MKTVRDTPRYSLSKLARAGRLTRALPGVYLENDEKEDFLSRCLAVGMWDPSATIIGGAAARLTFWSELPAETIEVSSRRRPTARGYAFTRACFDRECVFPWYDGWVLTAPAAALDVAVSTKGESLDRVLRSRVASVSDLMACMELMPGRVGNTARSRYLVQSKANAWSAAERRAHGHLRRHRIEGWTANRKISCGPETYFGDIVFEEARVVIEVDGFEFHSTSEAFLRDRRRQNALQLRGWTVYRFSAADVMGDGKHFIEVVRAALGNKPAPRCT